MRRFAPLVLLALALASCGSTGDVQPTQAPHARPSTAAASPTPSVDPACTSQAAEKYFRGIDDYAKRGAFESDAKVQLDQSDVSQWSFALAAVESQAQLQVYKSVTKAREALSEWSTATEDPLIRSSRVFVIYVTAQTLALECRVTEKYGFSKS